jgi:hypothetical protein
MKVLYGGYRERSCTMAYWKRNRVIETFSRMPWRARLRDTGPTGSRVRENGSLRSPCAVTAGDQLERFGLSLTIGCSCSLPFLLVRVISWIVCHRLVVHDPRSHTNKKPKANTLTR